MTNEVEIEVGEYITIFHSSKMMKSIHSNGEIIQHYFMGAYTFEAKPPFRITRISAGPIFFHDMYNSPDYPTYKPIKCIFPMGLLIEDGSPSGSTSGSTSGSLGSLLHLTMGKQDHESWVVTLDLNLFIKSLRVVGSLNESQDGDEGRSKSRTKTRTWVAEPAIIKNVLSRDAL